MYRGLGISPLAKTTEGDDYKASYKYQIYKQLNILVKLITEARYSDYCKLNS